MRSVLVGTHVTDMHTTPIGIGTITVMAENATLIVIEKAPRAIKIVMSMVRGVRLTKTARDVMGIVAIITAIVVRVVAMGIAEKGIKIMMQTIIPVLMLRSRPVLFA